MDAQYLPVITVDVPRERIYGRLGYAKDSTRVSSAQQEYIERTIEAAVSLIELKGCYRRLLVTENDDGLIVLSQGVRFDSTSLGHLLAGCEEAMLMAATCGSLIMDAIHAGSTGGDMSSAVVFDAVASEIAESGLNWITEFVNREIRREGRCFTTRRFSPGYGDLRLESQKNVYAALGLAKLGVTINASSMLMPEKTTTAVIGIRKIPESE